MGYTWQYYDLVLVGIVISMALGVGAGVATAYSLTMTVPIAGVVACALIGHGLFVNGPVDQVDDLTEEVDALN